MATLEDDFPRVRVNVGGKLDGGVVTGGTDIATVLDYSYDSNIMSLSDAACINVANKDGLYNRVATKGARVIVSMADPKVAGGASIPRLVGLVVNPRRFVSAQGTVLQLQCADQGWYLEQCDAPLWMNLQSSKNLEDFTDRLLKGPKGEDFGWGFQNADGSLNVAWNNLDHQALLKRLSQGAAGASRTATAQAIKSGSIKVDGKTYVEGVTLPPLQVETGQKVGQLLVDFARRAYFFVNVAPDGALVFFRPSYNQPVDYRLELHFDERRERNNVLDVAIDDSAEGIPTDVWCVAQDPWFKPGSSPTDFNADKIRARHRDASTVPHYMRKTVADNDQISQTLVANRAKWAMQRGLFDAWSYTATVVGHQQGGVFWAPDSMVAVHDSLNEITGNFYCSACRYMRDASGTRTQITLRRPVLFTA